MLLHFQIYQGPLFLEFNSKIGGTANLIIHLSISSSIYLSINPSIYLIIHQSIYSSINLSTHSSIYLLIHLSIYSSIYLSNLRTGMPAIMELGSSSAAELTVSLAPITRTRSVSGKSSLISSISITKINIRVTVGNMIKSNVVVVVAIVNNQKLRRVMSVICSIIRTRSVSRKSSLISSISITKIDIYL